MAIFDPSFLDAGIGAKRSENLVGGAAIVEADSGTGGFGKDGGDGGEFPCNRPARFEEFVAGEKRASESEGDGARAQGESGEFANQGEIGALLSADWDLERFEVTSNADIYRERLLCLF